VFSSVLHVILEHLNNLIDVELPCPTELEQEFIYVPRILGCIVLLYPLLELAEAQRLLFRHVTKVAIVIGMISRC
jgi:hypothetical protein